MMLLSDAEKNKLSTIKENLFLVIQTQLAY